MPRAFVLGSRRRSTATTASSRAPRRHIVAVGTCHAHSMTCCRQSLASSSPPLRPSTRPMNGARSCRHCRRHLHRNATNSIVLISNRSLVTPRPASLALAQRWIAKPSRVETRSRTCSGTTSTATRPRFGIFGRVHSSGSEMRTSWQPSAAFCGCGSSGKGDGWTAKPNKVERRDRRRIPKDRRPLHVNSPASTRIRVDHSDWCPARDMPHELMLSQKLVSSRAYCTGRRLSMRMDGQVARCRGSSCWLPGRKAATMVHNGRLGEAARFHLSGS